MPGPDFIVAIPARYGATRLPGKPLQIIAGEPMVVHVARRALAAGAAEVVVATDDERIAEAARGYPLRVCMTRADHPSGTDRLAECARQLGWAADQIVVNLQGDEPFAPPEGIRAAAQALADSEAPMATLAIGIEDAATLFDPNAVKVVRDARGHALYFSRAPMPWHRDRFARDQVGALLPGAFLRHIGIYAYRAGFLHTFTQLPPGQLEQLEGLEQLRVLEAGHAIAVAISPVPFPPGVDTEADLARANRLAAGLA
jgi:3-deoxy-manno-octulosonate cytidylyltransferase (CMP-KDO synthetase)